MARSGRQQGTGPQACVHVDLDGARHIYHLRGWPWSESVDPVYETGVPRALELFGRYGIRATFFVIAQDLEDPAKLEWLREIVRQGHDIASHSVTHTELDGLDSARKRSEIFDSRDMIEHALGIRPAGFRAPNFSIDSESLDLLDEAGYTYDSSMNPDRNVPGLARRIDRPSRIRQDRTLLELPLPSHRPLPFPFHPSYSLVMGVRYFGWGLDRFNATGAPLILLFHLIDFSDPLPARLIGGWRQRLFTLSHIGGGRKLGACTRMLDRTAQSYTFATTADLVEAASHGGRSP